MKGVMFISKVFRSRKVRLIVLPIAVFSGWYILQSQLHFFSSVLLPPMEEVLSRGYIQIQSGELLNHITASMKRIFVGYALAIVVGIPLGIVMGYKAWTEDLFDGLWALIRPIPSMAWIPLAILWFGLGDISCMFIVFYGCFSPILMNTMDGVKSVDKNFVRVALTLGAKSKTIVKEVVLPGAMPSILTGLRFSLGVAWAMVVASELIAASRGLGFMIAYYRSLLLTDRVMLGMITIGILGFVSDRIFLRIQKMLLPWVVGLKIER